ncbi:MAG: TolC family protein [Planctomycetes bacterium]|nr:TolC family protein [Planctomycetota bacterium]
MSMRFHQQPGTAVRAESTLLSRLAATLLAGVVALAGGCVATGPCEWFRNGLKVGPNYGKPPASLAQAWIGVEDPRVHGPPPRDGNWWEVFQDPILTSLINRAYQQNPNLLAVGTRVLQARGQQAIAVGKLLPQNQQVLGLYPYGTIDGVPTQINVTAFNLTWEVDFWGKYRRQIESSNAKLDASIDNYDDALVTLLADVATQYVEFRIAQQRIKIARNNLESQEKVVAVAERQQKVGTTTALDAQQLRTLMEQTRSTIPALQIALGRANDKLCILLGEPPHDLEPELGPGPDLDSLPMPMTPAVVAAGIPADLLRRRPDVRSAEREVASQSAQIGVAKADLYPGMSIGTALGHANLLLGPMLGSSGFLAFVTPQFTWNFLNYGRICNNIHVQEARTQELIASYQNKVLTASQEVQTALRGFLRSQEQADALARGVAAALAATRIEQARFGAIKADVNRLFNLENSQLQAQDQLAIAQGNIALYLINVYRSLGGGWELRLQADSCATAPVALVSVQSEMPASVESVPSPRMLPQHR